MNKGGTTVNQPSFETQKEFHWTAFLRSSHQYNTSNIQTFNQRIEEWS